MTQEWIIPLDSVRSTGLKREETFEEPAFLRKMAQELHILDVFSVAFTALITREKDGLRVKGYVKADVAQACSVSLAPVPEKIDEPFDVLFLPDAKDPNENFEMPEDIHAFLASEDPPEPLINNQIDLYGVIREFIALGLNPFPRKEGAEFTQPQEDNLISPFSALAQLTRKS